MVFSTSQNALSTTNPDDTRRERCSACCIALIPPKSSSTLIRNFIKIKSEPKLGAD
jgi:hypothetical protein